MPYRIHLPLIGCPGRIFTFHELFCAASPLPPPLPPPHFTSNFASGLWATIATTSSLPIAAIAATSIRRRRRFAFHSRFCFFLQPPPPPLKSNQFWVNFQAGGEIATQANRTERTEFMQSNATHRNNKSTTSGAKPSNISLFSSPVVAAIPPASPFGRFLARKFFHSFKNGKWRRRHPRLSFLKILLLMDWTKNCPHTKERKTPRRRQRNE